MGRDQESAPLIESLRRYQRLRWQAGERIPTEQLLQQHPELQTDEDGTLELIYNEIVLRQHAGESPHLGEYQQRFANLAARLELLFAVDAAFHPGALTLGDDGPAATGPASDLPTVPGYEIVRELGRGGVGVVYEARQESLNRTVALKMLLAGSCAGAAERARFRTEAEVLGRLHHPAIVPVYDVGEAEGRPYLVMEWITGGSLAQLLSGRPLPLPPAVDLLEKLAQAIQYAHEQGIVHRDLKPANVLLAFSREPPASANVAPGVEPALAGGSRLNETVPKITDFGMAKLLTGGGGVQTSTGAVVGTPSYMAPEQAEGRRRDIGPAADIYALGALLYEMLTGRPPFQGETILETLRQVQSVEPVSPSRLRPYLPRDLVTICLKCLQKEPARRYASAAALAEDLRRFRVGEPILARPVGTLERTWRWVRRNPGWAAMLGTVFTLLAVIAFGASLGMVWLNTLLGRAQHAERATKEKLFESYVEKARALRRSQRRGQRFDSLDTITAAFRLARDLDLPPERIHELRNEAIAALALLDLRPVREWVGNTFPFMVAFDSELERYARCDTDGGVSFRRVAGDVELLRMPGFGGYGNYWPNINRDGRYLSVWQEHGGRIKVWRLDRAPPALAWDVPTEGQSAPTFSPDGRLLAYALQDGTVALIDLESRSSRRLPPADGAAGCAWFGLALHPDGRRFAVATRIGRHSVVQIRALDTGQVLATLTGARTGFFYPVWHPGGQILAVADGLDVRLWDTAASTWTAELHATTNGGISLAFTPSGDLLASTDWNGETRFWEPHSGLLVFKAGTGLSSVQFSRDGRFLAGGVWDMTARKLRIWEVAQRCYRRLRPLPTEKEHGVSWGLAVSPDDRLLAASFHRSVGLWDLQSGQQLATVPGIGPNTAGLAFDGEGALWTFGNSGLWRWPMKTPPAKPGHIGPPLSFALTPRYDWDPLSAERQGRVIAWRDETGQWALHVGPPPRRLRLGRNREDGLPWVSPDGHWIALADTTGQKVRLLDAGTGRLIRELPLEGCAGVFGFSPDGRWLVAVDNKYRHHLWRTDTWESRGPVTGSTLVLAPDSRLLAFETGEGRIRLLDPAAPNHEFATLEDPNQDLVPPSRLPTMTFTRDGARLITISWRATPALHIWDLRRLRAQLAELDLDWKQGPYPPAPPARPGPLPQFIVDRGRLPLDPQASLILHSLALALQPLNPEALYQRALAYTALGRLADAVADCKQAAAWHTDWRTMIARVSARPDDLSRLARAFVTKPAPFPEARIAVTLAERAVELDGQDVNFPNTLGIAYYRAGRIQEAVATLEKSLQGSAGESDAFDLYFLALAHHRLADPARAKAYYQQARAWHDNQGGRLPKMQAEELRRFQEEAEEVLGLTPRAP